MKKIIVINENTYIATGNKIITDTNYNFMVHVFKNDEKRPICGQLAKHTINEYDFYKLAIDSIKNYETQEAIFQ